mgnify:CR=1 FL=1
MDNLEQIKNENINLKKVFKDMVDYKERSTSYDKGDYRYTVWHGYEDLRNMAINALKLYE